DDGFLKMMGCRFKEMGSSVSWARSIAASGIVAIAYTNREPVADLDALLDHVRRNGEALGVDETRVGLWASSGNVPLALTALTGDGGEYLKCAALSYGFMLDLHGSTRVAETAAQFRFANPASGKTLDDIPAGTALFVARAGQDQFPHLNESID